MLLHSLISAAVLLPAARDDGEVVFRLDSVHDARKAFHLLDQDGDDRITVLEALRGLRSVQTLEDFRQWDRDGDGVVHFHEFLDRFRAVVSAGGTVVVEGEAARRRLRPDPAAPRTPQQALLDRLFRLADQDGDGRISLEEWRALAPLLGVEKEKEALSLFENMDRDLSGALSPAEIGHLLPRLAAAAGLPAAPAPPAPTPGEVRLPLALAGLDTDGDGSLSFRELRDALLRLDHRLARFTREILEAADLDGDGRIGPREAARALAPPAR